MKVFVNALTVSRIIGTFFFPLIWFTDSPALIIAFAIFLMLTDSFDGLLARKYHVQTFFGMMADTIADKVLGVVLLFLLATKYKFYLLLIIFEVIIAFVNVFAAAAGANTHSSKLGKVKTWALGLSILVGLILMMPYLHLPSFILDKENVIMVATASIGIGSEFIVLSDYLMKYYHDLKGKKININWIIKSKKELNKVLFDTKYYLDNKEKPLLKILAVKQKN